MERLRKRAEARAIEQRQDSVAYTAALEALKAGSWVLVDYKTDRVEDEETFMEIYRPQLRWYAEAIRELAGKPVKEAWLYALSRRKAYQV